MAHLSHAKNDGFIYNLRVLHRYIPFNKIQLLWEWIIDFAVHCFIGPTLSVMIATALELASRNIAQSIKIAEDCERVRRKPSYVQRAIVKARNVKGYGMRSD